MKAATPTATPTPVPTYGNTTTLDTTIIDSGDQSFIPWEIYAFLCIISVGILLLSIFFETCNDVMAGLACIMLPMVGWLSGSVGYLNVETQVIGTDIAIIPSSMVYHFDYLGYLFGMLLFLVGVVNVYRVWLIRKKGHGIFENARRR